MGMTGIGSALSSAASQYDFTKLTNAQLLAAAQKLGSEGKISQDDAREMSFVAQGVDWTAGPNADGPTVAQTLADPTQKNWLQYFQQSANWENLTPGTIGASTTDSILKDLQTYQASSAEEASKTFSVQA